MEDLDDKIDPKFATENFDNFISIYGFKSKLKRNLYNKTILFCFITEFIKYFVVFNLNCDDSNQFCIYIGDITMLFQSLKKFFLIILLLTISFAIRVNYLFNRNSNSKWFEVFKCLDGTLTPKSIGTKDKKIIIKLLFWTKIQFKLTKIYTWTFTVLTIGFGFYLFLTKVFTNCKLITLLLWFPSTTFLIYFMTGETITAITCFFLICYYSVLNAKYFANEISNINNENLFGIKRLISISKIKQVIMNQSKFFKRIYDYNKFWSKFYFIMIIHFVPSNIVCLQQFLFGKLSIELRIIFIIGVVLGNISIVLLSLLICLLNKYIMINHKKLTKLQLNHNLNLTFFTKMKVSYYSFK